IVAIDEKTLDDLGSWPFSRRHYTRMLENLRDDGAAVIGFDVTFPKPDEKSGLQVVRRARRLYLEQTPPQARNPAYLAHLAELERQADTDAQFAEAMLETPNVVLGQFFYMDPAKVEHIAPEQQEEYEMVLAFGAYPQVRGLPQERGGPMPPPLAEFYTGLEAYMPRPNLMTFAEAVNFSFGYFNFVPDADAIARRTNLVIKYGEDFYPSLDVQVLRYYLGVPDQEFGLFYNEAGVEWIQFGDLKVRTDAAGRLLVNYQGEARTYPHISLSDVAAGNFEPGTFTGKMVLVGPTATAIADMHAVPLQAAGYPGVEVHANVLDTMLTQRFIRRGLREEMIDLGFILLFGLGVGFFLARVPPSWTTPLAVAVLVVFVVIAYVVFAKFQVWLNVVVPGSVLVANFGAVTAFRVFVEEREKRKVRGAFAQYIPPGLMRELLKDPGRLKLGGEERELTIMFSDIRGFTALSERLTPLELTGFLNSYTDEMTDIIFKHWGTLDKFEGDAIMAFWGAPYEQEDHSLRACAAALDMGQRVDELRQQWRAEGKPDVNVGLGLNSGRVVVGNMGSRKRFNYTVLGDPVNLASRLEGVNKEYTTRIIVSEFTHRQASDALGSLIKRVSRQFGLSPEQLAVRDGSSQARRARQLALYVGATKRLAAPKVLAQRFGDAPEQPEETVRRAIAQVEKWEARDKKIARFLTECRRSFHTFVFRQLDWIRVKGKKEPVAIHELLDYAGQDGPAQRDWADLLTLFESGLQTYRAQKWDFATEIFETLLERYPDDKPSQVFLARCREFSQEPPPPSWDGVYVMKTK
ncbi:MAG: CHASE2 domain-containing protein, partial [Terriglobia bacterium]